MADYKEELQSHKGSAETDFLVRHALSLRRLQSHKGSAETAVDAFQAAVLRVASIPQGFC